MPIKIFDETRIINTGGWTARIRPPSGIWNGRVILLLHGWTGDENTMWIFARKIPVSSWIVAPRGPLNCPDGGFAWALPQNGKHPDITQFQTYTKDLVGLLTSVVPESANGYRLDIAGFSQGAAMTYSMCLETEPVKIAPLAGYLPHGFEALLGTRTLKGLSIFIAHNPDDSIVSISKSREAMEIFESRKAVVHLCESTGGHKMSAPCFHEFNKFIED